MMKIDKNLEIDTLTVSIEGRLDTITAPQLEAELSNSFEGVKTLVLDLTKLDYISSAGLRVLLSTQKKMNVQGSMKIKNVNETVMEIFDVTGFTDILNIE